jgi:hypothetical protein
MIKSQVFATLAGTRNYFALSIRENKMEYQIKR